MQVSSANFVIPIAGNISTSVEFKQARKPPLAWQLAPLLEEANRPGNQKKKKM